MAENRLIEALQTQGFQVIETHISWVVLTGDYAYKIKKPVNFGFVDFSTLDKRKFFCEAEFKLNQPLASELYIGVIPITEDETSKYFNGKGPIIEYALQMKQFDQTKLLKTLHKDTPLTPFLIQNMAEQIAAFHLNASKAPESSEYGSPDLILNAALDNFTECESQLSDLQLSQQIKSIKHWTLNTFKELKPIFEHRKKLGYIRSCHGDLHLGNMVLMNGRVIIFDCIEFNDSFRFIDVMNDIAFLVMDLDMSEFKEENSIIFQDSYRFLNAYLEITGDYEGLPVLRFYTVYRAMVRAKVALLTKKSDALALFRSYCHLAQTFLKKKSVQLIITHGVSGSGKTTLTTQLIPYLMACRLRSDVERKRLFNKDLYSESATDATYRRLAFLAESILTSGYTVIIDATFLKHHHRQIFQTLAQRLHIPFLILNCIADPPLLQKRLAKRLTEKGNVSDATQKVLQEQLAHQEPLTEEEKAVSLSVNFDETFEIEKLGIKNIFGQ